jgi:hypothetical protein
VRVFEEIRYQASPNVHEAVDNQNSETYGRWQQTRHDQNLPDY